MDGARLFLESFHPLVSGVFKRMCVVCFFFLGGGACFKSITYICCNFMDDDVENDQINMCSAWQKKNAKVYWPHPVYNRKRRILRKVSVTIW